jgi:hypothetical protein
VGANWDFGYGSGLPQNAYNPSAEYANSDFDVRHRLTLSLTYAIPAKKGYAQALEGWELNSIVTLQSPQHWGVMDEGTDAAGIGPLPVSPPANSPSGGTSMGTLTISSRVRRALHSSLGAMLHPLRLTMRPAMQKLSRWMEDPQVRPPNHWPFTAATPKAVPF